MPGWPLRLPRGTGWRPEQDAESGLAPASLLPGLQAPGGHCRIPGGSLQLAEVPARSSQHRAFPGVVGFHVPLSARTSLWEV